MKRTFKKPTLRPQFSIFPTKNQIIYTTLHSTLNSSVQLSLINQQLKIMAYYTLHVNYFLYR